MARYAGPVCRLCRREGVKLFLKGSRCTSDKCALDRKPNAPGAAGEWRRKPGEYAVRLREKQKLKRTYGLMERQFRNLFEKAERKTGVTGEVFLSMLERRLDNTVYRMGFATSRAQARQMVRHGFFEVNGRRVNIPSYQVSAGDLISVSARGRKSPLIPSILEGGTTGAGAGWLSVDGANLRAQVNDEPTRDQIDVQINEQYVVEFYSR